LKEAAMTDYRTIFENDYPGHEAFTASCLEPAFGPIQGAKFSLNDKLSAADAGIVKDLFVFGNSSNFSFGEMNFFDVTLHDRVDIARSRVTIQRAVRKSLDNYQAAIVIFHSEGSKGLWRLSFVNKLGSGKETTSAKRYSYICGKGRPCRTTADRFLELEKIQGKKSLEDITAVFSIEALTKEFFKRLFKWYDEWAVNAVRFPAGSGKKAGLPAALTEETKKENRQHLIRLITRLIFVWFLRQKENLVPSWLFDIGELQKVLVNFNPHSDKNGTYYNAVLQNLFFATLNCEIEERNFFDESDGRDGYSIKARFRDHRDKPMIAIPHDAFIEKFAAIPFLNGGLFDCLDRRDELDPQEYKDGFSRESKRAAFVPNCLFFGDHSREGLVGIFSQYNFTIEENTPQDIEIALDPELLGKVFENLLGTYNEETAGTARNESGSFYTPREIVDYMVDSSLKEYLKGKLELGGGSSVSLASAATAATQKKLDALFSYGEEEHDFNAKEVATLIQAIHDCKILDPACGSGAFPMGILNRLTYILSKLDPQNERWKEKQLEKADAIDDRSIREKARQDIEKAFQKNELGYGRKLYLIENCIYGVDIQPIAIQISKLRFFISLIVDQNAGGAKKNNYGVIALPNLETKFVAANTLIGIKREQDGLADPEIDKKQKELLGIRHKHFGAKSTQEKKDLRETDRKVSKELVELLKQDGFYNSADAAQMAKWNPYSQTEASEFFDPWWMFGIDRGFDVVIGNPPYLKEGRISKEVFQGIKGSKYYQGKMDLWYAFACFGIDFLSKNGSLCFIATNNWVTSSGSSKMRSKVIADTKIIQLVDFGNFMIFENASIQTMVMLFVKDDKSDNYSFDYRKLHGDTMILDALDLLKKRKNDKAEYLNPVILRGNYINSFLTFSSEDNMFTKITKNMFYLHNDELANGIHPHYDFVNKKLAEKYGIKKREGIFGLSQHEKEEMKLSAKELKLIKPYYTTDQVKKYYTIPKNDLWIIYTDSSFKNPRSMDQYPNLKRHLDKYKNVITSDNKPYGLHRARDERFFLGEKIIVQRKCAGQPVFSYSDFDCYVSATFYVIKTGRISLKCLLGILNSKLIAYWLKNKGKMQGENYQLDKEPLQGIPLPVDTSSEIARKIEKLVNKILASKSQNINADTSALERQIDNLIYRLYNLTYEEVKVIEPEFPLSRAEYEDIKTGG
jgi:tRNA1(Val) A37 N6-methylase TrmN6